MKAKFNLGDVVWARQGNDYIELKIESMELDCWGRTQYSGSAGHGHAYKEEELYPTEEAAIDAIIAALEMQLKSLRYRKEHLNDKEI